MNDVTLVPERLCSGRVRVNRAQTATDGSDDVQGFAPPYRLIARELAKGNVVPFLGAGASMYHRRADIECPPSGEALSEKLADEGVFPARPECRRKELPRVASFFEHVNGDRYKLRDFLYSEFSKPFAPNALHRLLAKVGLKTPLIIITTNYDDMLERAFDDAKSRYELVVTAVDDLANAGSVKHKCAETGEVQYILPDKLLCSKTCSVIYKMHGGIDRTDQEKSNYLITEEDYVGFLSNAWNKEKPMVPPTITAQLIRRSFLFLGYSLTDWNFRVMLENLANTGGELRRPPKSWSIQLHPEKVDEELWSKKNVNVYSQDLGDFVDRLTHELQAEGVQA